MEVGPGTANLYFNILAPSVGHKGVTLERETVEIRASATLKRVYKDHADIVSRILPFANTAGGDIIGWDPERILIADDHSREMSIIVLPRTKRHPVDLCDSFEGFIRNSCFGDSFDKIVYGGTDPEAEIELKYVQIGSEYA